MGVAMRAVALLLLAALAPPQPVKVLRAVDGDTLTVEIAGRREKIRVLGIDTPETHRRTKRGWRAVYERCGEEAHALTASLTVGHAVTIESDSVAPDRDRFGRLLRHVRLDDGRLLSAVLVAAGLARPRLWGPPPDHYGELTAITPAVPVCR